MNQVIINRPLTSYEVGQLDASISVINTNLLAHEFDVIFRNAINNYITGWGAFAPDVQRTLDAIEQYEDETPEYLAALDAFMIENDKQTKFVDENKVFEHEGQKILLTQFIDNDTIVTAFSVMSLQDWLKMKSEETTTHFSIE